MHKTFLKISAKLIVASKKKKKEKTRKENKEIELDIQTFELILKLLSLTEAGIGQWNLPVGSGF